MTAMGDSPEIKKLYQKVASSIADGIAKGEFSPAQRLPAERDLAERFGVSRPTIREAMIALEIQRLVEARQGSGVYVIGRPHLAAAEADLDVGPFELTEARRVIEGEVCALAAVSIEDSELEELRGLLLAMAEEVASSGTPLQGPADRADKEFHLVIARAARNSALLNVVETLWELRYRSPLCREMLARARRAGDRPRIEEHRSIVEALAARDSQGARSAMHDHLQNVVEGLLEATESEAVSKARQDAAARREAYIRRALA